MEFRPSHYSQEDKILLIQKDQEVAHLILSILQSIFDLNNGLFFSWTSSMAAAVMDFQVHSDNLDVVSRR